MVPRLGRLNAIICLCCAAISASPAGADGWRDSLSKMRIPDSPARGRVRGEELKVDRADLRGSHLHLRQGKDFFSDREFAILIQGSQKTLQGRTLTVSDEDDLSKVPVQIHMSWKPKGDSLPKTKMFMEGFLMRLELGRIRNGRLPGRIYLCIPDFKRSYVAGTFVAVVR